jgi:hypothetical protein
MTSCLRLTLAFLCITFLTALAFAQDKDSAQPAPAPQTEMRTSADETFDLNISEKRITEKDFEASTSVEAGEESARGLRLRIGVGIGADAIDVLLRNVRGRVRFRATLAPLLDRINSRRTNNPSP